MRGMPIEIRPPDTNAAQSMIQINVKLLIINKYFILTPYNFDDIVARDFCAYNSMSKKGMGAMLRSTMIRILRGWSAPLLLPIFICVVVPLADAQLSTASINGTVRDATDSVIPDVSIVLRNVNTGVEKSVTTNQAGIYEFLNVQP